MENVSLLVSTSFLNANCFATDNATLVCTKVSKASTTPQGPY